MTTGNRPLSPHLQVYRPQLTAVLSIVHRLTGVLLAVGTPLFVLWLGAAAVGPAAFEAAQGFFASWIGRLVLLGWSFALFYHLCNGIRHLCWDLGWGFELRTLYVTGWTVVGASVTLTLAAWIAGYAVRGAWG